MYFFYITEIAFCFNFLFAHLAYIISIRSDFIIVIIIAWNVQNILLIFNFTLNLWARINFNVNYITICFSKIVVIIVIIITATNITRIAWICLVEIVIWNINVFLIVFKKFFIWKIVFLLLYNLISFKWLASFIFFNKLFGLDFLIVAWTFLVTKIIVRNGILAFFI